MARFDKKGLKKLIPYPTHDANKYSRGQAILYGGSQTYPGAIILAARAAQRAGAGYTEVFTESAIVPLIQSMQASLVVRSWEEQEKPKLLSYRTNHPCAYLIGPGIDLENSKAKAAACAVIEHAHAPVVIDGGALDLVTTEKGQSLCLNRFVAGYDTVLTPHFGEAMRLAHAHDLSTKDPDQLCLNLSLVYGAIVVLKGPVTYVSDGEEVFPISNGSPALAKAGTGDVLAGIITAFLAQKMDGLEASVLGVTVHAKSGCIAAEKLSIVSVIPEDIIEGIAPALMSLAE